MSIKLIFGFIIVNIIVTLSLIIVYDEVIVSKRNLSAHADNTSVLDVTAVFGQTSLPADIPMPSSKKQIDEYRVPVVEEELSTEGLVKWEDLTPEQQKEYEEKSKPTQ